jgi:hypothetical protein
MKLTNWIGAGLAMTLWAPCATAYADPPRSVFCMATRTTPRLDQNNYVVGAMGKVFVTRNFTTDIPDDALVSRWRAFIIAKHPATIQGVPDDNCYPETARRSKVSTYGDVKNLTVNWTPEAGKPQSK